MDFELRPHHRYPPRFLYQRAALAGSPVRRTVEAFDERSPAGSRAPCGRPTLGFYPQGKPFAEARDKMLFCRKELKLSSFIRTNPDHPILPSNLWTILSTVHGFLIFRALRLDENCDVRECVSGSLPSRWVQRGLIRRKAPKWGELRRRSRGVEWSKRKNNVAAA